MTPYQRIYLLVIRLGLSTMAIAAFFAQAFVPHPLRPLCLITAMGLAVMLIVVHVIERTVRRRSQKGP